MNIDVHTHYVPRSCFGAKSSSGASLGPQISCKQGREEIIIPFAGRAPVVMSPQYWDPETRLKEMDAAGLDVQVVSVLPPFFYYELDAGVCLPFCRVQNDGIAQLVKDFPKRFIGLATLPLQDPIASLPELDRAINKLGMRGIQVGTSIAGHGFDWPELDAFYREVEKLRVPLFIHPTRTGVAGAPAMKNYHLGTIIGNPFDTTLAALQVIFGGVLERFPELIFCLAHGGGTLPFLMGRAGWGFKVRPECREKISRPPAHYLRSFYFDSMLHSAAALKFLIDVAGLDRVVMGTDYPADMGDPDPVASVSEVELPGAQRQDILGGNASRLLGIQSIHDGRQ